MVVFGSQGGAPGEIGGLIPVMAHHHRSRDIFHFPKPAFSPIYKSRMLEWTYLLARVGAHHRLDVSQCLNSLYPISTSEPASDFDHCMSACVLVLVFVLSLSLSLSLCFCFFIVSCFLPHPDFLQQHCTMQLSIEIGRSKIWESKGSVLTVAQIFRKGVGTRIFARK